MLLGGDLGLFLTAAASAIVVVSLLLVRAKWRRVVARRVEIERLMALASEEAARAEVEAVTGYERSYVYAPVPSELVVEEVEYDEEEVVAVVRQGSGSGSGSGSSPGRQLQYQCEVCFSPTTSRCKQCKAVHYCSPKCQIIHWRQGHKYECHSLSLHQNFDAEIHSRPGEKQNEIGSDGNVTETETRNSMEPIESSPRKKTLGGKNEYKGGNLDHFKGNGTWAKDSDTFLLDERSSNTSTHISLSPDRKSVSSNRHGIKSISTDIGFGDPLLSEQPVFTNPVDSTAVPDDQLKSCLPDIDGVSETSSLSSFTTAGSEEHLDLSDDSTSPQSSLSSLDRMKDLVELGSDTNKVVEDDDPHPAISVLNKSSSDAVLPNVNEVSLESQAPVSPKESNHVMVKDTSINCTSKAGDTILSSSNADQVTKTSEPDRGVQALASKQSDAQTDYMIDITNYAKSPKKKSEVVKVGEFQLSKATNRKPTVPGPHFVEKDKLAPVSRSVHMRNDKSGTNLPSRVMDKLRPSNFIPQGSSDRGTEDNKKYKGSFSYELFVKLYNWNKFELRPCGLVNCGNSCYANAVLQCLSFTPPLAAYFLEGLHSKACEKQEWCFACELEILVRKAKGSYSPISPARIISQMQCIGRHLGDGKEEDAHEFLRYAIDAMQSACLKGAGINRPSSLDEETSLIGLTFGGYLRSKIECTRCGGISEQQERIMDLTVEIGGDIGTLEEALRQFTRSEILDGENKYHCDRCNLYVKAKKKLKVSEAPNVLTIALKRFQSGNFGKLNKAVKFPEILNLAPYMCGTTDRTPIYVLYGVVVHLDIMNAAYSGHYVCYIKNKLGTWFQADDSTVRNVEVEKVLSKGAYMLLYARCSPRAPRAVRTSVVSLEPRKSTSTTCQLKSHPKESWNVKSYMNRQNHKDCIDEHCRNHHTSQADFEDGNSSENSSSFFSESGSHTTDSSTNRESTSTDENLDHILRDLRNDWTNPSDSDTSSPSSSPSPLHSRFSPLSDLDRNSTEADRDGFWTRTKGSVLCPDLDPERERDKLVCSNSYRENDSSRLGQSNNMKGGVYLRRSATGRTVEN